MFVLQDAFEVDGLLLGGVAAIFTATSTPQTNDYPEAPVGSQCIVPEEGVYTKYSDGTWRRSVDSAVELEELVLYRNGEPECCFFADSVAKVRV